MTARLFAVLLGTAAGGGYPQWNCRCPVCQLARDGDRRVAPRTQTSVAVSGDGRRWVLLNAAPEIASQIAATAELHPPADGDERIVRSSPICAVVLTGAEVDQCAGLLGLREQHSFDLVATAQTHAVLGRSAIFEVLPHDRVRRRIAVPDEPVDLPGGLCVTPFAVPGKVPLYLEAAGQDLAAEAGGNIGLEISAGGARLAFVPGAAAVDAALLARLAAADLVLFDGTLFTDDEMMRCGAGTKTGRRMGHMPISGEDGSLAALSSLSNRRLHIHINNTNPVLVAGSPERRAVEEAGWEVACDGMRFAL